VSRRATYKTLYLRDVGFARVEIYWYRLHALTTCVVRGHRWREPLLFAGVEWCERCASERGAEPTESASTAVEGFGETGQ
jgi:hypothetical protein